MSQTRTSFLTLAAFASLLSGLVGCTTEQLLGEDGCVLSHECGHLQVRTCADRNDVYWEFDDGTRFDDTDDAAAYCTAALLGEDTDGATDLDGCLETGASCADGRAMYVCTDAGDTTWVFDDGQAFTEQDMADAYCGGCLVTTTSQLCLDDRAILYCDDVFQTETGTFEKEREALYACTGHEACELRVVCPVTGRVGDRCVLGGEAVYFDPARLPGEREIGDEAAYGTWCNEGECLGGGTCLGLDAAGCHATPECSWNIG